jgi:hypothetical protein
MALPRVGVQMNHKIGLSGILRLVDVKANRLITPSENDRLHGIMKGCPYTRLNDIGQLSGYKTRHIFKNKDLIIDPSGTLRVMMGIDQPKSKGAKKKPAITDKVKRETKLKVMNAAKMKALIYAAVNTFRHSFDDMRLHFFTVSFPPCVDVKNAKRFLNIWLTKMRKDKKIFMYLWVMEFQKNGTAHFHLLIPGRLNVRYANRLMKETLTNAVKKREINWTLKAADKYNGVDIQKNKFTKKVTNFADPELGAALAKYLSKYITKNNAPSEHQRWHCSREWAGLCTGVALTEAEVKNFWGNIDHSDKMIETPFFVFYRWNKNGAPAALQKYLAGINFAFLKYYFDVDGNTVTEKSISFNPSNN